MGAYQDHMFRHMVDSRGVMAQVFRVETDDDDTVATRLYLYNHSMSLGQWFDPADWEFAFEPTGKPSMGGTWHDRTYIGATFDQWLEEGL